MSDNNESKKKKENKEIELKEFDRLIKIEDVNKSGMIINKEIDILDKAAAAQTSKPSKKKKESGEKSTT